MGELGNIEVPGRSKHNLVLRGGGGKLARDRLGKGCLKFGELLGTLPTPLGVRKSKGVIERASMLSR